MSYVEAHTCYGIHKNLIHIEHLRSSNEQGLHVSTMKVLVSYETDFGNEQRSAILMYVSCYLYEADCNANSPSTEVSLFQSSENDVDVVEKHTHSLIQGITDEHLHPIKVYNSNTRWLYYTK